MTSADIEPVPHVPVTDALLGSLARRDFDQLAAVLEPDVVLRALLPGGFHEWTGPERVTEAFGRWFGRVDEFELVAATVGVHGPRLQLSWRARVRGGRFGDAPFVVNQHVYADPGPTGRIQTMAMLCSGFTEERSDG
ncbi:MAG: nuclear transport factor 2 family protein [Ilumatobacteraceae bacterium]